MCLSILTIIVILTNTMADEVIAIQKKPVVDFDNLTFMVLRFWEQKNWCA